MTGQMRDFDPGRYEKARVVGQPLQIALARGAIPAQEGVTISALPRRRPEERTRHGPAVPVAHQIPEVLAHRVAMPEVVVMGEQAVEKPQVFRSRRDDFTVNGRNSRSVPRIGSGLGCTSGTTRLRLPLGDGPRRGGRRMWPARSNFSSSVRAAISLRRPCALRHAQRSHNSTLKRDRHQSGCSSSRLRIVPMSAALNSRPCSTMTPVMPHKVQDAPR